MESIYKSTEIAYIYALIDPENNIVRYIGKTVVPKFRLSGHISESKITNTYKSKWIRKLLRKNLKPIFKILKICNLSDFVKYETEYINLYKSRYLTNSDDTGQGNINRRKEIIDRAAKKTSKIVYQYTLNGIMIRKFKSVREASRNLSISHANISRCCNGIFNHTNGFIFRYKNEYVDTIENPNAMRKRVMEIDSNGNGIQCWYSIMDCSRDTKIDNGNISRVCNKLIKSIKNRIFIFKE